jgi:hypothetical protein
VVELAAVFAGPCAVDHDEPQRAELRRVLNGLAPGAGNAEVAVERIPVVVVAGQDERSRVEAPHELANLLVLVVRGVLRQVARDEHGVRALLERAHGVDRRRKSRDRVDAVPRCADVRVAQLDEQEGPAHAGRLVRGRSGQRGPIPQVKHRDRRARVGACLFDFREAAQDIRL